jgi:tetratricopeptide (TPR) repeat protein
MMKQWSGCFIFSLMLLSSSRLQAETSLDYDTCGDVDSNIEDRIRACTRIATDAASAPNQSDAYRNRGAAYIDRGQFDLAVADETKAIGLNARDGMAYNLRAWAYLKSGDPKKALADADKALSISPDLSDALDTRGQTYEALGMRKEAIQDYRKALAIDPDLEESNAGLSRLEN